MTASSVQAPSLPPAPAAPESSPLRIVALGTSLTAEGGWTAALAERLGDDARVEAVAMSGAGSRWALGRVNEVAALRPDIVLIELTANDAAVHRGVSLAESRGNLRRLLESIGVAVPNARRLVMAMNPAHGLRGLLRWRLDRYADAHLALAGAVGAERLDTRPDWRAMSFAARRRAIPDGLHPHAEAVAAVIVPLLLHHLTSRAS